MQKKDRVLKDFLVTVGLLTLSFLVSLLFQHVFPVEEHVTTVIVFAVFLISLFTSGYLWGIVSALIGALAVHFAFTFPYFTLNLPTPTNLISAAVMLAIALTTGTLTSKLKRQEALRAEGEKERMRANLLRAVSHDLRTPLTAIYGSGSALLEHREQLSEERKIEMLRGIKTESEWLMRMVDNLLSVTRVSGGDVTVIKIPTALEELIDAVLISFRSHYPGYEVDLHLPEEITFIPMDAVLMRQVLSNLLENAVLHATHMTRITLAVTLKDGKAVFAVGDDGCGISPDRLDHLFDGQYDPGEGADSHRRSAGIGLSVCAAIVRAHGGEITAENKKEGGAVFRFALDTETVEECDES